ncbi:UNVERIFIED_CONTAM: hypothetical protein Sradi_4033700 [Sesamum radiatum]|uniref:Uncharacterized protein n=1 Tax=Sesamum radiatum TaxID=300843 RepID=A0AAW2PLC6_SESRA
MRGGCGGGTGAAVAIAGDVVGVRVGWCGGGAVDAAAGVVIVVGAKIWGWEQPTDEGIGLVG